jgi:hypothetical protein
MGYSVNSSFKGEKIKFKGEDAVVIKLHPDLCKSKTTRPKALPKPKVEGPTVEKEVKEEMADLITS